MKTLIALLFVGGLAAQTPPMIPMATGGGPVGGATNLTTVGSVPYVSASGTLDQDAGQFFWDATNNRLGIGTATPGVALDVTGVVRAASEANAINTINIGLVVQRTSNDSQLSLSYKATPDAWVIGSSYNSTGAYKPIALATSDLERMRITASGNVGIGTTTPGVILDILSAAGEIRMRNDATNTLALGNWDGTAHSIKSINLGIALTPLSLQASRFEFNTGNVGIGTTAPAAPLNISYANSTSALAVANAAMVFDNTGSQSMLIWRHSGAITQAFRPDNAGNFNAYASGSQGFQFINALSGTAVAGISNTGLAIGSASGIVASYALDVQKTFGAGTARFYDQTATTGSTLAVIRAGAGQSTNDLTQWQNNAGTVLSRVTSAGWLGIGATTPAYDLDIYRNSSNVGLQVGNSFGSMIVGPYTLSARPSATASAPRTNMYFDLNSGAGGTIGSWIFQNGSVNAGVLKITNSGSLIVGSINTSEPVDNNFKLEVAKSGSAGTARFYDQTATTGATRVVISLGAADTSSTQVFEIGGLMKFSGLNSTGAGTALLGTNSPATTNAAPYTWLKVLTSDGSTGYIPVWK